MNLDNFVVKMNHMRDYSGIVSIIPDHPESSTWAVSCYHRYPDSPLVQFPILTNRIIHHHVDQLTGVDKTKSLTQPHTFPQERLRQLQK